MYYLQTSLGLIVFVAIAWSMSEDKNKVPWKVVVSAIILQIIIGILLLKIPFIREVLFLANKLVWIIDQATKDGTSFIFGYLGGGETPFKVVNPQNNFIIAFHVLPIVIIVSAISALLFHWGILQWIIKIFSWPLQKTLKLDGATGLGVASAIFLGMIESPLFIRPYLKKISYSGLFTLITAGMATIAGTVMVLYASVLNQVIEHAAAQLFVASVMSAPAAIMFAQIIVPPQTTKKNVQDIIKLPKQTKSSFEAIVNGTNEGVKMVIGIIGILIVLFAFISLINTFLALIPAENPLTIEKIAGKIFIPFCWLMGIPPQELSLTGELMGTKLLLNEFVAYMKLSQMTELSQHSQLILTYAMCGFANFGSLGILVGGLGTIIPERKEEVLKLSLKGILAGTLSTMYTGIIIGLLNKTIL